MNKLEYYVKTILSVSEQHCKFYKQETHTHTENEIYIKQLIIMWLQCFV